MNLLKKIFNKNSGYDEEISKYIDSPIKIKGELLKIFNQKDEIVIFDIGACEGADSIRYKKLFPQAKIFAFEPLIENVKKIKHNFKRYNLKSDIELFNLALGEKFGKMKFFVSAGRPEEAKRSKDWDYENKSSSLLPPKDISKTHNWLKFKKEITVEVDTIKNICQKNSIDHIDFIHLDVQGAEIKVLKGAGDLIRKIRVIWLEVANLEMYEDQPLKDDIERFMHEKGFKKIFEDLDNHAGDQLYLKNEEDLNDQIEVKIESNKVIIPKNRKWCFQEGHYYERNVEYWIRKILKELDKPVFYDVGANIGIYSIMFADLFKTGYAFEPVSDIYKILKENIKRNAIENVDVFRIALSNREGKSKINLYSSSGCNSLIRRNIPEGNSVKFLKQEEIKLARLDLFIERESLDPPTVLKIDVEGAEKFVLEGAKRTLHRYRPIIVCEYSEDTCSDAGYKREEIIRHLPKDYNIWGLSENYKDFDLESNYNSKKIANIIAFPKESIINKSLKLNDNQ
jgi:FkbM family methyltransferase